MQIGSVILKYNNMKSKIKKEINLNDLKFNITYISKSNY